MFRGRGAGPTAAIGVVVTGAAAVLTVVALIARPSQSESPEAGFTCRDSCVRPYDRRSPWNTPIPADVRVVSGPVAALLATDLPLSSDPDQYTFPVYLFDQATPRRTVKLSGFFSSYDAGDDSRVGYGSAPTIEGVPVPSSAVASAGDDGQLVLWDPRRGIEYGFSRFERDGAGLVAANGYRYHTTSGYHGRFADGLAGRGAGTPYLAGLVRPWEIARGRIEHALTFGYDAPSSEFVFPASKSDGVGRPAELAEGSRLQLDPTRTEEDFDAWGLTAPAKVIARALQKYGMYVVDNAGAPKLYLEDRTTARWRPDITRDLVRGIPMSAFRLVASPPSPAGLARSTAAERD